jgi:hypothetical protein
MTAILRKLRFFPAFVFIFISPGQLIAQTDNIVRLPQTNTAFNDVSEEYEIFRYKPQFVTKLPDQLKETSGLIFIAGQLWTLNDGGNKPELYQIDTGDGHILRTVFLANAKNSDWESMTQDDSSVYIGDFGNNTGSRKDLCILKIAKSDLFNPATDSLNVGHIYFSFLDQSDFSYSLNRNDFDCEAFFFDRDSLHLFSKNWQTLLSKHYVLPTDTGIYQAGIREVFDANGLITDVSVNESGNIVMLGYKNTGGRMYSCFAWLLSGYADGFYFNGSKRRMELGSAFNLGQTEGIVLLNDNTGWLSSESIFAGWMFRPARLFRFDFMDFY